MLARLTNGDKDPGRGAALAHALWGPLGPETGRFSLVDPLPSIDWGPVRALAGAEGLEHWGEGETPGALVALPDGDALLVGRAMEWDAGAWVGFTVRSFRFDATDGIWRTIDQQVVACDTNGPNCSDAGRPWPEVVPGHSRGDSTAVTLADGTVLIAGGIDPATAQPVTAAELFDPATGAWTDLPPLPEPRAGAAAAVLGDRSVILVGGYANGDCFCQCEGGNALATSVRFVPEP